MKINESPGAEPAGSWIQITLFALTIFLSAFLLFQVQPLISRFILPWFGGTPAVWTTAMLFFQFVLFAGYSYAHLLTSRFQPKGQVAIHGALLLGAIALLPIVPSAEWKPTSADTPMLRILLLLLATVGIQYFSLSATGPLLQAWFSRVLPSTSPYRLFALSNFGSLLALLSYPVLFERWWSSIDQARFWSGSFAVFALSCGACAFYAFRTATTSGAGGGSTTASNSRTDGNRPTWTQRALWIGLPAIACILLLAVTNHVCQDIAVIPMLWIVPLSLYLLSFIVSFDHPRWYSRRWYAPLTVVVLFLAAGMFRLPDWLPESLQPDLSAETELLMYFSMLFLVCMLCHGELARLRPDASRLTDYYLMISAGGAIGGLLVSLVAPNVFKSHYEWPLALLAGFAVAAVLTGLVLRNAGVFTGRAAGPTRTGFLTLAVVMGVLIHQWQMPRQQALYRDRNFYGAVAVFEANSEDPLRHEFQFRSGIVQHGRQYADPAKRRVPVAYYSEASGCGRAMQYVVQRPGAHVGVIGLGVGTVATYMKPGQRLRLYEINPAVEEIARRHFTYLKDCEAEYEVVIGDARLSLERETPNQFDAIVLDAFTGDSIPTHLLTDEAFAVYKRHLKPDGLLIVHITNSYLLLHPVAQRLAHHHGFSTTRIWNDSDSKHLVNRSDYLIATTDQQFLDGHPSIPPERPEPEVEVPLWTDRYSNLFSVLR